MPRAAGHYDALRRSVKFSLNTGDAGRQGDDHGAILAPIDNEGMRYG
jgi:hypothetical protein